MVLSHKEEQGKILSFKVDCDEKKNECNYRPGQIIWQGILWVYILPEIDRQKSYCPNPIIREILLWCNETTHENTVKWR